MIKRNWYLKLNDFIRIAQFSEINNSSVKLFIIFHGKKAGVTPKDSQEEVQSKAKRLISDIRRQIINGESYRVNDKNIDKYLSVICRAPQDQQSANICRSYRQNKNQAIVPYRIKLDSTKIAILVQWYNYLCPDTRITKNDGIKIQSGQINKAYDMDTNNQILSGNPAFCYLMLYDVLKSSDKTKITKLPPHLDASKIMQVYQVIDKLHIKQDSSGIIPFQYKNVNVDGQIVKITQAINIGKMYAQAVAGRLVDNNVQQQDVKDGWVVLLGWPKVNRQQFKNNVLKSTRLGKTGEWCLSGKSISQSRLRHKDLYFLVKDQDPKICINVLHNGNICQIQGKGNSDKYLVSHLSDLQQFMLNHPHINFKNTKVQKMIQNMKKVKQQALNGTANVADVVNLLKDGQYNQKMNPQIQKYICDNLDADDIVFLTHLPFDRFKFLRTNKNVLQFMKHMYIAFINDAKFDLAQYKDYGIDFSYLLKDPSVIKQAQIRIDRIANTPYKLFSLSHFIVLQNIVRNFPILRDKIRQDQQLIETLTMVVLLNPVSDFSQKINKFYDDIIIKNIRSNEIYLNSLINKIEYYIKNENFQNVEFVLKTYGLDLKENPKLKQKIHQIGKSYISNFSYYKFVGLDKIFNLSGLKELPQMISIGATQAQLALNQDNINIVKFSNINLFFDNKFDYLITQPIKQEIIQKAIRCKILDNDWAVSLCLQSIKMDDIIFKSEFVKQYLTKLYSLMLISGKSINGNDYSVYSIRKELQKVKSEFGVDIINQPNVNNAVKQYFLQIISSYVNYSRPLSQIDQQRNNKLNQMFDIIEDKIFQYTRLLMPFMKSTQVTNAIQMLNITRSNQKQKIYTDYRHDEHLNKIKDQDVAKVKPNTSAKSWYKRIM